MASEPTDEPVSVSLPPELAEWVDQRAAAADTDRETVLVQLLSAHRATESLDDGATLSGEPLAFDVDLEDEVRNILADRLPDIADAVAEQVDLEAEVATAIDEQLDDHLTTAIQTALDEELADEINNHLVEILDDRLEDVSQTAAEEAVTTLADRLETLESEFMAKVEDARDRVIQVKKETDRKAPAEHDHPELLDRIDEVAADLESLSVDVEDVREDFDGQFESHEARFDDLDETVWDVQEKLQTVAYVVKDLREENQFETKRATSVDQIKQAAAEYDLDRAKCEACGQGVKIGLMTAPECPHCEVTVTDVVPSDGFLGKPKLVKAQGIEPADDGEDA